MESKTPTPFRRPLLCFAAGREYYRDVLVAPGEIFASPSAEPSTAPPIRQIRSAGGVYDLAELIRSVPGGDADIDLVVVRIDASWTAAPRNLGILSCPKVLVVGDLHHRSAPLRQAIAYARSEPFDAIVIEFNRNLIHFFIEAGLKNAHWLPAFTLSPIEHEVRETRVVPISFAGQVGEFHPYRTWLLKELMPRGLPLIHRRGSRADAAATYAESLISLNVSLNGDLNLRVFESLASGGFLLTDRLAPESALSRLFDDGEHLICFEDLDDAVEKIQRFMGDPAATLRIARAGQERYQRLHRPEVKIKQFIDIVRVGADDAMYVLDDRRAGALEPSSNSAALSTRLAVYEFLQELHRTRLAPQFIFGSSLDERFATDAIDLVRARGFLLKEANSDGPIQRWNLRERVHVLDGSDRGGSQAHIDVAVCGPNDLAELVPSLNTIEMVVVVGWDAARNSALTQALLPRRPLHALDQASATVLFSIPQQ